MSVKKYLVKCCHRKEITTFIETWHYSKNINGVISDYTFKLIDKDQIIGAMIYGRIAMANVWKKYVNSRNELIELRRLCCIDDTPKNTESYFIGYTSYKSNMILRDTKTKKEYLVDFRDMTNGLLDSLRERTGTKVLGFYISSGKQVDRNTMDQYFPSYSYDGRKTFDRKKVMAEFRKNKCLVVKHSIGYDEFYLLAGGEMQVTDGQMATPSENAKKSEIKRLFASNLKTNRDSRIVLNKFISQVA